ncbi:MAG: hypothetical protein ACRDMH_11020 [Solirubrobacterales bacterium]
MHEGGFSVRRTSDDELVFLRPDGREIPPSPSLPLARTDTGSIRAHPLMTGTGERMDLAACVDAVFAAAGSG